MNKPKFIADIDRAEFAVRFLEGALGLKRPIGVTALEALEELDEDGYDWLNGADNAMAYIVECMREAKRAS